MNAPRFDMYTMVHKGQRKRLFELTLAAGQLTAGDAEARESLVDSIHEALDAIVEHAHAEDEFLGPLYRQAAAVTGARFAAEHAALDASMLAVRASTRAVTSDPTPATHLALYRALSAFTGLYLTHIDAEERSLPELWARFDDATLARTQGAIVASHPPATVQFNLRNMLPAATSLERVNFLVGLRRNMPAPAFAGMRAAVGAVVSADEWSRVDAA